MPAPDTGKLCIDLESMWDDFERAALDFMDKLRTDKQRRKVVLGRWRRQQVQIVPFGAVAGATAWEGAASLSVVAPRPEDRAT